MAIVALGAVGQIGARNGESPVQITTDLPSEGNDARAVTNIAEEAQPTSSTTEPTTTAETPAQPIRGVEAEVMRVIDGDSIRVSLSGDEVSIRAIGIDAPEPRHPSTPAQCFGREAADRAEELLEGQTVVLEYDESQGRFDAYGNTLAYLWLPDGRLYTTVMLEEGFAIEYTFDAPYAHLSEHLEAEARAKKNDLGLWAASRCNGDLDHPVFGDPPEVEADVYYANCAAARKAGAAPIFRGEPGYRSSLDRDGNGVACE